MPAEQAAPVRRRPVDRHWSVRLRDWVSTYVPLLLMLMLAGATWWLVRLTPVPAAVAAPEPSPSAPDYTLTGVDLQRWDRDGQLLARVRGRELRHFPQGDRMDITEARIRARLDEGWLDAQSQQAVINNRGDLVRLTGGVVLQREGSPQHPAFDLRGSSVLLEISAGRAASAEPVTVLQEGLRVQAAGFDYQRDGELLELRGPVRGIFEPTAPGRR